MTAATTRVLFCLTWRACALSCAATLVPRVCVLRAVCRLRL
jgi:hypothetical protein